ncbi:MAG: SDR family oxidoreductase, partial [Gemmatimonadota bacterium]|nr:SDR family oxidoreductase [Gemmatimonadota bacterium]
DNIVHNCNATVDHRPVGVSWLPQYHDMGLIGYYLFFSLKGGTTYGFSPLDFIRRPALWLETISTYRGTASSAPNFAYEYCLRPDKVPDSLLERFDLSSLRFLMTAAEPVRASVYRDFIRRFEPCGLNPRSFFAAYGLAEFTLAVSNYGRTIQHFDSAALRRQVAELVPDGVGDADATTLVSCGRPLGATQISIVDVSAAPRATRAGEVGEIWLSGPSKCAGYWQRPEMTAAIFESRLPTDTNGRSWLRTGDMGFLHDGELYVCGRSKDMLIVRGLNYYPQDIEIVLEEDPHIRKGCVAAFANEKDGHETLVVVAELRDRRRIPDAALLNRQLLRKLGIAATQLVFIPARTIPKTSSGKIARYVVRQRWLDGQLEVLSVVKAITEAVAIPNEGPRAWLRPFGLTGEETCTLPDAGFDSLRLTEFALALEQHIEAYSSYHAPETLDVRVLQRIAICELVELVDQVVAAAPHALLRLNRALTSLGREHRSSEADLMRRDARLRADIAALPRAHAAPQSNAGVLLTGGTGFFGPFLLASLLEQESGDIHVLVRPGRDPMGRIGAALRSISEDGESTPAGWERRVRPVCGDLAAPNLGLDAATWRQLASSMDTIYHNGAAVNYLLDYAAMRETNVGGTNEIVRLAMCHRPKVLNHISTTFVFGWSVQETLLETDTNAAMDRLDFGYSQSKWVSEQVVLDAMRQGLDARIFRPALLTPSLQGGGSNFDIAIRLLSFMIRHGITTTARNQVSFTPADLAANNIVGISRIPESIGASFHVTRDEYACLGEITTILGELTGREFREYAPPDFVPEVISRCRPGDILFPLLNFLVRSVDNISAMEFKRYDNATYRRFRDLSAVGK